MDDKEAFLKDALSEFLRKHAAEESISSIDEIVLSYLVSILEDLGTDSAATDAFDVEEFTEMMEAYLPGFSGISSVQICEWMFDLAARMERGQIQQNGTSMSSLFIPIVNPCKSTPSRSLSLDSATKLPPCNSHQKRTRSKSERGGDAINVNGVSHASSDNLDTDDPEEVDENVRSLMEMFPTACTLEIKHCLCLANSNVDEAVGLILHRQETGEAIKNTTPKSKSKAKVNPVDDHKLKESIINKYSYVDTDELKREHRPLMPKMEPKKLVRYLDNKVVSTKGERFTEMKKDDGEDMKKTYVNIKPAKQYRFH